jgi:hypothetical protein
MGAKIMKTIAAVAIMLCAASTCPAGQIRSSDARPSMPYAGTAVMQDDGTLTLRLRLTSDGQAVSDTIIYKVGDRAYDDVLRHLGGMSPGDTRQFRPWKD